MSPFESLLIVDLGGTTLDVAKVQGNWQDQPGVLRSTRRRFLMPMPYCR